jgi:hypothetical protein
VSEFVGKRWEDPARAVTEFNEIVAGEGSSTKKPPEIGVDLGADCFEEVERGGVACLEVGMQESEAWVETDGAESHTRLGFGERVDVVQQRICWVRGPTRRVGSDELGPPAADRLPALGDRPRVSANKADRLRCPSIVPIGLGRSGLEPPALIELARILQILSKFGDGCRDGAMPKVPSDTGLAGQLGAE